MSSESGKKHWLAHRVCPRTKEICLPAFDYGGWDCHCVVEEEVGRQEQQKQKEGEAYTFP